MANKNAYEYVGANEIVSFTQLTATSTGTEAIDLRTQDRKRLWTDVIFQATVASINTDVSVYLQGSLDNINWFNLDLDEGYDKYAANGTYGMRYQGKGEILFIRLYFYTETGGTAATIDSKAKIFGKLISHISE